jgi:glutathione S-transferase
VQQLMRIYLKDVHDLLLEEDRAYFRESREALLGCTLEEAVAGREARMDAARAALDPVRITLTRQGQPFLSGQRAGYADYMMVGLLLWIAGIGTAPLLQASDPLVGYFERVRDLHGGVGRTSPVGPIAG